MPRLIFFPGFALGGMIDSNKVANWLRQFKSDINKNYQSELLKY